QAKSPCSSRSCTRAYTERIWNDKSACGANHDCFRLTVTLDCPQVLSRLCGQPRIHRNHEQRDCSTGQGKACANEHHNTESEYKCFANQFLDSGSCAGVEVIGHLRAGQLDLVG